MKKQILTILFIAFAYTFFGQISDATLLAKVKSLHPKNRISAKLDTKGYTEKKWENNGWVYYYRRGFSIISKTKHAGIKHKYTGSLQYKKVGSKYNYDLYMVGDGTYIGVPSPNKSEILELLKPDIINFLGDYHYKNIVGTYPEISLVQEKNWKWTKLTMLELKAKATFTEKVSAYKTETSEHIFKVVVYSEKYKGKWTKFNSHELEGEKKLISSKEYSYEDLKKLKTLKTIDTEKVAKGKISNLPSANLPVFNTDKELYYFIHKIIMTKDAETVKSYLYKVMSKQCKEEGSDVTLTYLTQQWFDKITNNLDTYKKTHCMYPTIKHYQNGQIRFFDKENKKALDFEGIKEDGTWKIYSVRYYPARGDAISRMANTKGNCEK